MKLLPTSRTRKAIRIIERLKKEMPDLDRISSPWMAEANNYLAIILGPDNMASRYMDALDRSTGIPLSERNKTATTILDGAIRVIKDYGVYREKKTNFLYRIDAGLAASLPLPTLGQTLPMKKQPTKINQYRSWTVRIKIMACLYDFIEDDEVDDNATLTAKEVSEKTGLHLKDVMLYHEILGFDEHITCVGQHHNMSITKEGRKSVLEGVYENKRSQYLWDRLFMVSRTLVPLAAFVISVVTLLISTCNNSSTSRRIERLEQRMETNR